MGLDTQEARAAPLFAPRTVTPPPRPLTGLALIAAVRRNLLELFDADLFERPFRPRRSLGRDYLAVCCPELIQAVLLDHADAFQRAESQRRLFQAAVGEGLFTAEGPRWRRQRRAAAPAFRHELLRRMVPAFADEAANTQARLVARAPAGPIEIEAEMRRATLAVVSRTLLAGFDKAADPERLARTLCAFSELIARPGLLDLLGAPGWLPSPSRLRLRREIVAIRAEARHALHRRRSSGQDENDLLAGLIAARDPDTGAGLSDAELVDNILTFIGAGHETSAVALTWALGCIARAPDVQQRLAAEARDVLGDGPVTADAVDRLCFHEQVLNEALRLFTPTPMLLRQAIRDVDLGPVMVRRGTEIWCNLYVLHRSPRLWNLPDAFDPDRFSPERADGRHRFAFLPFGAGPRICIGARFAMMEAKTMLATLVRGLQLAPAAASQPLPAFRFTVRPAGGMWLNLRPRVPVC